MVSSIRIKETQYQLVHGNPLQVERESGGGCLATSPGSSLGSSHRENQRILSCPCCLGLLIMVIYRLPDFLWGCNVVAAYDDDEYFTLFYFCFWWNLLGSGPMHSGHCRLGAGNFTPKVSELDMTVVCLPGSSPRGNAFMYSNGQK